MTTKKAGRPRIEFDLAIVEGLGRIGATIEEMAAVLPASKRTVADRMADGGGDFRIAYEKGRAQLKTGLRRKQIQVAMTGSVAMLIWLGKQQLEQTDRRDTQISLSPEEIGRLSDEALQGLINGDPVVLPRHRW